MRNFSVFAQRTACAAAKPASRITAKWWPKMRPPVHPGSPAGIADVARQWLRVPEKARDNPFSYEETVSAITVSGDTATITFPKRK